MLCAVRAQLPTECYHCRNSESFDPRPTCSLYRDSPPKAEVNFSHPGTCYRGFEFDRYQVLEPNLGLRIDLYYLCLRGSGASSLGDFDERVFTARFFCEASLEARYNAFLICGTLYSGRRYLDDMEVDLSASDSMAAASQTMQVMAQTPAYASDIDE